MTHSSSPPNDSNDSHDHSNDLDKEDKDTWMWVNLDPLHEVNADGIYPYQVSRPNTKELPVVVVRTDDRFYALYDECPHRRIQISESGYIEGDMIFCGWHNWGFKLESGAHMIPTGICVDTYEIKEEDGFLWVKIPSQ